MVLPLPNFIGSFLTNILLLCYTSLYNRLLWEEPADSVFHIICQSRCCLHSPCSVGSRQCYPHVAVVFTCVPTHALITSPLVVKLVTFEWLKVGANSRHGTSICSLRSTPLTLCHFVVTSWPLWFWTSLSWPIHPRILSQPVACRPQSSSCGLVGLVPVYSNCRVGIPILGGEARDLYSSAIFKFHSCTSHGGRGVVRERC